MKIFWFLILFFFSQKCIATTYYVSNTGADGNNGTSISTPWQTLTKVNTVFSTLAAGDRILFKRGDTFQGSLIVSKSGTASLPIFIGAYDVGEKPIITAMTPFVGTWTDLGGGKWRSPAISSLITPLRIVTLNGVLQPIGRYPNASAANSGYLTFKSEYPTGSTTGLKVFGLSTSPSRVGAEIVVRTRNWRLDRSRVTSQTDTILRFSPAITDQPYDNYGYFFQDHISTLDLLGEWCYDTATKKITMYFGAGNPTSYTVAASNKSAILDLNAFSYINVDNLQFIGGNSHGIDAANGNHCRITNCDIKNSGNKGFQGLGWNQSIIDNCTFDNSLGNGIKMSSSGGYKDTIINSYVHNSAVIAGMGESGDDKGNGIYVLGANYYIKNNRVINTGFNGIYFNNLSGNGGGHQIINNFVDSFDVTKDDGAGIYTFNSARGGTRTAYATSYVRNNVVSNGIGEFHGTTLTHGSAMGIYLDGRAGECTITGNTVFNCTFYGIFFNNSRNTDTRNNTFYNTAYEGWYMHSYDAISGAAITNNTFKNNVIFSIKDNKTTATASRLLTFDSDFSSDVMHIGSFDSNYYCRPLNEPLNTTSGTGTTFKIDNSGYSYYSYDRWAAAFPPYDAHSKRTAKQILSASEVRFEANTTNVVKTVSLNNKTYIDHAGIPFTNNVLTLQPYSSKVLIVTPNVPLDSSTNTAPNVALTSPAANQQFTAPATVTISATASDNVAVAQVDFYNGNTLLFSDMTSPYSYTWSGVAAGNYTVSAKAIDNAGLSTSASRTIIVNPPLTAPTVSLTSPANNQQYISPATVNISATASDVDGTIASVQFYRDSTLLFTDVASPYAYTWTGVAAGTYAITAKATDNNGLIGNSGSISIRVSDTLITNSPPTVTVTVPTNGQQYTAPATINMTAVASDVDGTVVKVDWYNGTTFLHSDATPSSITFTQTNVPVGNYRITAVATDNSGNVTTSNIVSVIVNPVSVAPTVSITAPTNNATYTAPASVTINATASDADGTITQVEFYNGTTFLGSDNVSPYTYNWTGIAAGSYSITAKATDNSGLFSTSGIININVTPPVNVAPTVSISSPANNTTYTQPINVQLTATAADADGTISQVDFYEAGVLLGTDNTSPYTFSFNNAPVDTLYFTAVATDNLGKSTTSSIVNVIVKPANGSPLISLTAPANNAQYIAPAQVNITAIASDSDGYVANVKIYNGTTLLSTDSISPYNYSWTSVPAGSYTLKAVATDNSGVQVTSNLVNISVRSLVAPVVSITAPANNATYVAPGAFTFSATATDPDGTVSSVAFYRGTTLIGTDNVSPYSIAVSGLAAGSYALTARATDNDNLTTISAAVNIVVSNPKTAPTVSITSPTTGSSFSDLSGIVINATATDADGTVSRVDFFRGTTKIGSDFASPYTITWNGATAGTYSLTAKAIDNDSLTTTSFAVSITVTHVNVAPTVVIVEPASNDTILRNQTVQLTAVATDKDGSVTKVEFYSGSTLIATVTSVAYSYLWKPSGWGTFIVTAKAYDNSGAIKTSQPITITVLKKPIQVSGLQIIIL